MKRYVSISKAGFLVTSVFYALLLVFEWIRPGFVSFVFSPHLLLIPLFLLGAVLVQQDFLTSRRSFAGLFVAGVIGVLLGMLFWRIGEPFEEARIFVSLFGVFFPIVLVKYV